MKRWPYMMGFALGALLGAGPLPYAKGSVEDMIFDDGAGRPSESPESTPPEVENETVASAILDENVSSQDLLALGLRFDTAFTVGAPFQQGFSLPSLRLTAFGEINPRISYRLSLGQTREFSTVLLPQIIPVESYMDIKAYQDAAGPRFRGRIGMFTPTFNPLWSPDLSDLDLPDYGESHRALLMSRDLGAEAAYETSEDAETFVGAGVFNGNGLLSINSNNSRAITVFARATTTLGSSKVYLGGGYLSLSQSARGSINFRSETATNVYAGVSLADERVRCQLEILSGDSEDSTRVVSPSGGAVTAWLAAAPWSTLFLRFENLDGNPADGGTLRKFQIGPLLMLGDNIKAFLLYDYTSFSTSAAENAFLMRLRINI